MIRIEALEAMSKVDFDSVDSNNLVDINIVKIDAAKSQESRIEELLCQIRNPYCFKSGDTPVRVRFKDDGKTLRQLLIDYFSNLK